MDRMESARSPKSGRKVETPVPMPQDTSRAEGSVACPGCGTVQNRAHATCTLCGLALTAPGMVYRRQADGTWTALKDFDLSSAFPTPKEPRRGIFSRRGLVLIGLLGLFLTISSVWAWRERRSGASAEALAILEYLSHPLGTIVPQFQLQFQHGDDGSLRVAGQCNLPPASQLEVRVFAEDTVVAIDYPVIVTEGRFETRPLLDRGRPFTPGTFRLQVGATFAGRWQPPSVLLVVGSLGQRLQGPLVSKQGDATGATLTYSETFTVN